MNNAERAVKAAGGSFFVANKLKVSRQTVAKWAAKDNWPPLLAGRLSDLTGGLITPHDICPKAAKIFGVKK